MSAGAEADYEYALQLHAEMNDDLPHTLVASSEQNLEDVIDYDADFALALHMQFNDSAEAQAAETSTYASTSRAPWNTPTTPTPQTPPRETPTQQAGVHEDFALYGRDYSELSPSTSVWIHSLTNFTTWLRTRRCLTCQYLLVQSVDNIIEIFKNWQEGNAALTPQLRCLACMSSACIACDSGIPANNSSIKVQGREISWCCSGGRLFLLWVLLCGFDHRDIAAKQKHSSRPISSNDATDQQSGKASRWGKKVKTQVRDNGVGFGGYSRDAYFPMVEGSDVFDVEVFGVTPPDDLAKYYGAKRARGPSKVSESNDKVRARKAQNAEDSFNACILKFVWALLPSPNQDSGFDVDPPGAVPNILLESKILGYCAELLRNDSLEDASKRRGPYDQMLNFLETVSLHPSTSGVVFNERPVRPDKVDLLVLSFQDAPAVSTEGAASLFEGLRNLTTQSNLLLQGARAHAEEFRNTDGQNILSLCRRISELFQTLDASNTRKTEKTETLIEKPVAESITDLPHDEILATHAFAKEARSLRTAQPGRMKRLITEITTLNTGLPPGIFVRYGSDRPDILKVIIIGPCGTPYENGMFEFDLFCPTSYPHEPPMVKFKTTGGGAAAFNPNLYPCGKVCLSLLGTWQGEPWKSGESTLLQVLISLQAMILCEEPWYNEPGREGHRRPGQENPRSKSYNHTVRMLTVRHAILGWVAKPRDWQLWNGVVNQHFKQNGNRILETVSKWATEKKPEGSRDFVDMDYDWIEIRTPMDMGEMLPQLQAALRKYGATFVVPQIPQTPKPESKPPRHRNLSSLTGSGGFSQFSSVPPPHPSSTAVPYIPGPPPPNPTFTAYLPGPPPPPPFTFQEPLRQYHMPQQPPPDIHQPASSMWEPVFGSVMGYNTGQNAGQLDTGHFPDHYEGRGRGGGSYGGDRVPPGRGGYNPFTSFVGRGGNTTADPSDAQASRWDLPPPADAEPTSKLHDNTNRFLDDLQFRTRGGFSGRGNRGGHGGFFPRGGRGRN